MRQFCATQGWSGTSTPPKSLGEKMIFRRISLSIAITSCLSINSPIAKASSGICPSEKGVSTSQYLSAEEVQFLKLINQYRAQNRLGPLEPSSCITTVSRWLDQDMGTRNYFDHQDSLGRH